MNQMTKKNHKHNTERDELPLLPMHLQLGSSYPLRERGKGVEELAS